MVDLEPAEPGEAGVTGHRLGLARADRPSVPSPAPPGSDSAELMQLSTLMPYISAGHRVPRDVLGVGVAAP